MDTNSSARRAISSITLRQLEYFAAVAEEEHFTHAAERLSVAQPALSRAVSDLEETLGVDLFLRAARGVRLTEAGRELLARTGSIFNALERTVDSVRQAAQTETDRLRLGYYGPSFYNNIVTRTAFERFRAAFPNVEVISHELFSQQLLVALRSGRIDIGLTRGVVRSADIDSRVIDTERAVVLIAETDALAGKPELSLADLDGRGVIAFEKELTVGLSDRIGEILRTAGIDLQIVQEVTQMPSLAYHVARNEGIGILPASAARWPYAGVAIREISDPEATIDLVAVMRSGEESSTALRFMSLLEGGASEL